MPAPESPEKDAQGRVVCAEVMVNNDGISNLIRKGKEYQISSLIVTGRAQGMQVMDHELARLVREGMWCRTTPTHVRTTRPASTPSRRASRPPPSLPPAPRNRACRLLV